MILYYILVISLPLISHPLFEYTIGGITTEKYLGAVCLIYALISIPLSGHFPSFFKTLQAKVFLVFYIYLSLSYALLGREHATIDIWVLYTSHFMFFIITLALVNSASRLRWASLAATGSVGLAGLYTLREWQGGMQIYGAGYRPGAVAGDPNYYTASTVLCLPLMLYLLRERKPLWQRVYVGGCLVAVLLGIMVASSRGGFLGMVAAILVFVGQSKKRLRNLAVICIVGALLVSLMPSSPIERLFNPTENDIDSKETRLRLWNAGLAMFYAHPVIGVGLGTFGYWLRRYVELPSDAAYNLAHNTYIEIAAELGVPGLFLFAGLFVTALIDLQRTRKLSRQTGNILVFEVASASQAGLVGFAVAIITLSASFLKLFWFVLFISACLPQVLRRAAAQTEALMTAPVGDLEGAEAQARSTTVFKGA